MHTPLSLQVAEAQTRAEQRISELGAQLASVEGRAAGLQRDLEAARAAAASAAASAAAAAAAVPVAAAASAPDEVCDASFCLT